jgi:cobalamin biosynthesis protein CbiG
VASIKACASASQLATGLAVTGGFDAAVTDGAVSVKTMDGLVGVSVNLIVDEEDCSSSSKNLIAIVIEPLLVVR